MLVNASGVEDIGYGMSRMFKGATSFNQNISGWTINSGVTSFYKMFEGTTSFDQDLGGWNITGIDTAEEMFKGVTLSTANYSALLIGWEAGTHNTGAVKFHGGSSQYSAGDSCYSKSNISIRRLGNYRWRTSIKYFGYLEYCSYIYT